MSSGTIVALELVAILGVLIGLAGWDLYAMRQDSKRDKDRQRPDA